MSEGEKINKKLKRGIPLIFSALLGFISPFIIPILIGIGLLIVGGVIFFIMSSILTAILGLFDISNVPYFYVKNPAPYNIPAVNEPYDRDYQKDVSGFSSNHPEMEFKLLSNIQFYSENPIFLSTIKIPTSLLDIGTLRIKEGKLYSVTKGTDFKYSFVNPADNVGISEVTTKSYKKDFDEIFGKDGPILKFLYEKPGDNESVKNLRVDRIPKAYGVNFVRNDKENGYEVRFYVEFQNTGKIDMLTRIMAARARDVMYETFFYKKDDGSISKAFSEVGNSFWNKTVTKDFQEYTETYALPEMEKLQGKEELKKTFRKLHECINKYRGDKEEDIGCPTEYKDRLKTVAESSDKLWISDNLSAMQSWVPTMKCSTDWMQSPYIRMYEDSATGLCSDDKVELSPNPFLFSVSELIGAGKESNLDYVRDFKDNFGNSAAYSLQKFVDEVVKPSYIDSSQSSYEYQDIYKIYLSKFFQNGTLEKNFPKYWNTWIFYLYPFNVSQYGIGKYVFFNNNTKEITERYPKGDYGWGVMRTINVYAPFTGTQRLPEQVDDLRKTIDPGATKAFRKEFLLTPSAYNTDGKVTVGRIEDFKSNVLSCQYPECTLNDTFGKGKTELPMSDARASYFYLFKEKDGFFKEMVQKGFGSAISSNWKGFLSWFAGNTEDTVSKFFNSYAALVNDEAILSDFKKTTTATERTPLEFLTYYREKEFNLTKILGGAGISSTADLRATVEQDRTYVKYRDFFHEFVPFMAKTEGIGEQEVIDGEICKKRTFSDPEKCINAFMFLREAWNSDRSIGYYSAYSKFDQLIKDYSGSLAPSVDSYSGTLTGSGK